MIFKNIRPLSTALALCICMAASAQDTTVLPGSLEPPTSNPSGQPGISQPPVGGMNSSVPASPAWTYSGRVPFEISLQGTDGRNPDGVLRVVNKESRTGDVALMILGAFAGSFRTPVAKENYRGTKVEQLLHPARRELQGELTRAVDSWHVEYGVDAYYKNPIRIRPETFALIFGEYTSDTPTYELVIRTVVQRTPDSSFSFMPGTWLVCSNSYSEPAMTLQQWADDDYAMVKARGHEHVQQCAKQVREQFGKLFKN
jgi:hypothetical protein